MYRKLFPLLLVAGCASANGLDGRSAVVNITAEPEGSACEFGGLKIESGADANDNGRLDATEVEDSQYVCNGADKARATLTRASEEAPGTNCEDGGVRIDLGLDTDENDALGDEEVQDTEYICNGGDGMNGTDGSRGIDGTNGTNGTSGTDGTSYLTSVTAVGAGGPCGPEAGARIEAGPDANANGVLDAAEVADSEVICNGSGGGGGALAASQYAEAVVISNAGVDVTIVSVSITVPGPGTVVAFGETDAYCSTTTAPRCDSSGSTPAYVRVVSSANDDPTMGPGWGYVHLADEVTENVQRSNTFVVQSAGTYTYYLRGEAQASIGDVGFWRNQITAVYLPE